MLKLSKNIFILLTLLILSLILKDFFEFYTIRISLLCALAITFFLTIKRIFSLRHLVFIFLILTSITSGIYCLFLTKTPEIRSSWKNPSATYLRLFSNKYNFYQAAKKNITTYCDADLETDLDLEQLAPMTLHRQVGFLLFPEISIRHNRFPSKDCKVFLFKENAKSKIPPDQKIIFKSPTGDFIVTQKEKIE